MQRKITFPASLSIDIPPPALLALLYAVLVATGAGLLMLPVATTAPISWSDALFTATSAVTVTGLVVVDTGSAFTIFGQAVIMVLIQLGGLGLMTFAVLVITILGFPVGLTHHIYLREDLSQTSISDLGRLVWMIIRVVLACELVGVAVLAFVFVPEFGWAQGLWHALFHAISAFNNAGFALFPDSLSRWATDPIINIAVPAMFIIGGLGFTVLYDLNQQRNWRQLSLHSKLMLSGTLALIVWAVAVFAMLEWNNPGTLGQFGSAGEKLAASWFQAVTPRTAGFNTIDIGQVHDSTALMLISLMLIGGGTTSTAGGIKVTIFIVLLLAIVAFFKRRASLHAFQRNLGPDEMLKVLALVTLALLMVMMSTFFVSITSREPFLDIAFEVASAFGTVGLSRGATGELDQFGRTVIMILMFVGRVGPLTLGVFLATRIAPRVQYPSSKVMIG